MPHFNLFADYFAFVIQDEQANPDFSESITDETIKQMIVVLPEAISIGTARNTEVPVAVEVLTEAPTGDQGLWDRVNECSISIPSGKLVVMGGSDYFPDATRIEVKPGLYGVRVYYRGLNTLSKGELSGDDSYRVVLWPTSSSLPLKILVP